MNFLLLIFLLQPQQLSEPEQLVSNFYNWYVNGGYRDMKPTFKELENGMTDMDFSKFNELHQRFNFSEELVQKSRGIYQECRDNLSKIKYKEFKTFQDLDQFENISCSFQFYQWFGLGMDPYFYFELTGTRRISDNKYEITVGLANRKDDPLTKQIPVTVELINNVWKMTNIEVSWK